MRKFGRFFGPQMALCIGIAMILCLPFSSWGASSPTSQHSSRKPVAKAVRSATIPALFVSDIHIDPFRDPAKVPLLVKAPVSEWKAILSKPDSPDQQQAYDKIQQSCHTRTHDTSYGLFQSALKAMRTRQPHPKFITVSGDLVVHDFPCLYAAALPQSTMADQEKFVIKTIQFVVDQLRASFPGVPVYVAMGNHDAPCNHDEIDANSSFLTQVGRTVAAGLPPGKLLGGMQEFDRNGSYSVMMSPLHNTRLIVLDDLFLMSGYKTCAGVQDYSAADAEMAWFANQLAQAKKMGQKVWVLGHLPPGIAPGGSIVCGAKPRMYLATDRLANLMIQYANIIRLGVFAHTHSDEIRLFTLEGESDATPNKAVAIKIVPSITPSGHDSSFTIAQVNPRSAVMMNYQVVKANGDEGANTTWTTEYDFRQAYHQLAFTPATLHAMIAEFAADPDAKTEASQQYIRSIRPGKSSSQFVPFWPKYVCAISNASAKGYQSCACPASK